MEHKVVDSADFELPPITGITGFLDYLREWGNKTGTERLLAVRPDGNVLFDAIGNDAQVGVPPQYHYKLDGHYLLHNHPSLPSAISIPDIFCATAGNNAEGILAVCDDGSVTWSHGIAWDNANPVMRAIPQLALGSFQDVGRFVQRQIDRAVGDTVRKVWDDGDDRYVVQSDLICELAVRKGMLLDYYRNSGPQQEAILSHYKGLMKERLVPPGYQSATRPYSF